jgi:hypothetical protein
VRHRYEAVPIFAPDPNLLDGALFGASRVRRVNEANEGRWRSTEAADLPSRDASSLTLFTLTLTHGPNIGLGLRLVPVLRRAMPDGRAARR